MSWWEYLLQFLPPVFAIYLILVSGLAGRFVTSRIEHFTSSSSDETLRNKTRLIQNFVLSGVIQISFLNSMFAAMVSAVVIGRLDQVLGFLTFLLILIIFIPLMLWISAREPDDLPDLRFRFRFRFLRVTYATGCKIVLVIVNVILCFAIWLSSKP